MKWSGLTASKSFAPEKTGVNDLALKNRSTRQFVLERTSSVNDRFLNTALISILQV